MPFYLLTNRPRDYKVDSTMRDIFEITNEKGTLKKLIDTPKALHESLYVVEVKIAISRNSYFKKAFEEKYKGKGSFEYYKDTVILFDLNHEKVKVDGIIVKSVKKLMERSTFENFFIGMVTFVYEGTEFAIRNSYDDLCDLYLWRHFYLNKSVEDNSNMDMVKTVCSRIKNLEPIVIVAKIESWAREKGHFEVIRRIGYWLESNPETLVEVLMKAVRSAIGTESSLERIINRFNLDQNSLDAESQKQLDYFVGEIFQEGFINKSFKSFDEVIDVLRLSAHIDTDSDSDYHHSPKPASGVILSGKCETAFKIIQSNIDKDLIEGKTIGSILIENDKWGIMEQFIAFNPKIFVQNGQAFLDKAIELNREVIVQMLISRWVEPSKGYEELISKALNELDSGLLKTLIKVLPDGYQKTRCLLGKKISDVKNTHETFD